MFLAVLGVMGGRFAWLDAWLARGLEALESGEFDAFVRQTINETRAAYKLPAWTGDLAISGVGSVVPAIARLTNARPFPGIEEAIPLTARRLSTGPLPSPLSYASQVNRKCPILAYGNLHL